MAQPSRRVTPSSTDISLRKKTGESAPSSNSMMNGVAAVKPKVSKNSAENSSPYNQTISSMAKTGHTNGELSRRVSQREKPAIPAKPPLSKVPPVRNGKTNGVTSVSTTTTVSHKSQSHGVNSGKRDSENRVNGTEQKKTSNVNGDSKSPNAKGRVSLEITLEKKIMTPVVRRKTADREGRTSTTSSSEESSPSQSPTKSVHFKSSRSSSASSLDSRDRLRLGSMPGNVPRYQTHTISSADKVQGRAKLATSRTSPGVETSSDTCLNGFSSGPSVEPIRRSRARSVGPIRRVHSNEMVRPKRDISPKSKDSVTVRSKSVERTRNRQSFGGFVQRQRQAWEERSTPVTRRPPSGNQSEKAMNRRSLDPNHAPKIMQQSSVSVTQRKHMLFGKGTAAQKVKSKLEENPVNKPTSPTSIPNKQDVSQQVPKVKSSSADVEVRTSAKSEVSGQIGSRGNPQGDSVLNTDQKRTSSVDNPPEKPSVLQEIAPSPGSKPNAPNSLPLKPTYQNADANHRISPAKENDIGQLTITGVDLHAGDAVDETDNGKIPLFIDEDLLGRTDVFRPKPIDVSNIEGKKREEFILGYPDPKEMTKTDTLTSLTAVDDNILEVEGKVEAKDLAKEKEKAGITNGEDMGEKDGHYFLRVVNEEQSRIEALCRRTEQNLDDVNLSDEASGVCRAALGKANLLTSKKFKQFRGLCEQNITPSEEAGRCTTASDLAGFWDMVMIQVDDINSMFADIEKMKENNWKMPVAPAVTKPLTRKTPTKLSGRSSYGRQVSRDKDDKDAKGAKDSSKKEEKESRAAKMRQAREEARKRLIAAKKQAARTRIKSNSSETEVEIYTASGQQQA